jgi:lathosterol oxidase
LRTRDARRPGAVLGLVIAGYFAAEGRGHEATAAEPAGLWATRDDRSGVERAVVRVAVDQGRLDGHVERTYPRADEDANPRCTRCDGSRKGAPIIGMTILWGHHRSGDRWIGGRVLDPENGREYASQVWLDDADTMKVRGYWGPFHRTQTWRRRIDLPAAATGGGK